MDDDSEFVGKAFVHEGHVYLRSFRVTKGDKSQQAEQFDIRVGSGGVISELRRCRPGQAYESLLSTSW